MRFRLREGFDLYRKPSIDDVLDPDISHWRREVLMYRRRRMDLEAAAQHRAFPYSTFPHLGCGPWAWTAHWYRLDAKIRERWGLRLQTKGEDRGWLDYRCSNCDEEEHDICWVDEPDDDCVCCAESFIGDRQEKSNG